MTEGQLTRELIKVIERTMLSAVVLKHAERFTSGIPDMSVTWHGVTSWWECKRTPGFTLHGLQTLTCRRLAAHGICRYIIFGAERTRIVHPNDLESWRDAPVYCAGYDMAWIAEQVRDLHNASTEEK